MFTADAHFEFGAGNASFADGVSHQLAHAVAVEGLERILDEDAFLNIGDEEVTLGIVAGITEGHLGEIVGAEGEELRLCGDMISGYCGARDFDHGAELVGKLDLLFLHDSLADSFEARLNPFEFLHGSGERDHDFRFDFDSAQGAIGGGFKDGANLHLNDLRHGDAQTHTAQAHHRVGFVHTLDGFEQFFLLCQIFCFTLHAHGDHFFKKFFFVGHELMQRRVDEADDHGVTVHRFEETVKVFALMREQEVECGSACFAGFSEDHALYDRQAFGFKEHVLGAAQADTNGAV